MKVTKIMEVFLRDMRSNVAFIIVKCVYFIFKFIFVCLLYMKGTIYCIIDWRDDKSIYVGSTTGTLCQRMAVHRNNARKGLTSKLATYMRENDVKKFHIVKLEDGDFETKHELLCLEEAWRGKVGCDCNVNRYSGVCSEDYQRGYREKHKEKIRLYQQVYRQKKKKCEEGSSAGLQGDSSLE